VELFKLEKMVIIYHDESAIAVVIDTGKAVSTVLGEYAQKFGFQLDKLSGRYVDVAHL